MHVSVVEEMRLSRILKTAQSLEWKPSQNLAFFRLSNTNTLIRKPIRL